ncbi:hypothetical protein BH20ACI1_BH20ACI1_17930 [soil metagenome]
MINFAFTEPTFKAREERLEICQTIYDANVFDVKNWKNGFRNNPDMLPNAIINFLNLLNELEVDYAIVGGIAYLAYIEDRNTKDLDILISVKELDKILPFVKVTNHDANFTNAEFEGLQIDFLKTTNSLFDYVKENETTVYEFTEGEFPIATIEGLVLMRFDAIVDLYQKGNFNKIIRYESDLQFLTINHDIDWANIWKISEKHFTDGQIREFQKMVAEWQKPRRNPVED